MLSDKTKEALKSALLKLGIEIPATPVVKLEDITLMDNTILSVDKLEVGAAATFTGADGVAIPADGSYETTDGQMIVCAAGVITEIKQKEADPQPEPNAESETKAMLNKLSERLDSIEKRYLAGTQTLEAQLSENRKGLVAALEAIEEFNNTSVSISLEAQKTVNKSGKKYEDMTNHEKMLFNKGKLN